MQAAFNFTPGLTAQFATLRDIVNVSVYTSRASLEGCAAALDTSPSLLGRKLARGQADERKLDLDEFVRILEVTGDTRPIQWLIEKFLHNPEQQQAMAVAAIAQMLPGLLEMAAQAGLVKPTPKAKR